MENYEKAILHGGEISFAAKGKNFTAKPLPLKYIANGEFQKSGLYFPKDKANVGQYQIMNLTDEARRAELDKWLGRLLFLDGDPVTLEQICEWDWDINDVGRWLDLVVQMSG